MTDLPHERCTEATPFTYSGVDMFGLLIIKEGGSELKRCGALFACFSSRAVRIEVTNSLDADSFILTVCRFMGRRGTVHYIRSDNRTNFVGARGELQRRFKEMIQDKIKSFLQENGADWVLRHNNLPGASHMGEVWENYFGSIAEDPQSLLE